MLGVNLWQPKRRDSFEATAVPSALLILPFRWTSFSIQSNGVGVINSCGAQTMSPLWPPVCKWNSQQSTRQEVILAYTVLQGEFREILLSIISKWNSACLCFFPSNNFENPASIYSYSSWQWNFEAIHQGCQYPLSFVFYSIWANKRKQSIAALSSETDCCLVSLMCYLTNQAVRPAVFPSSGIESYEQRRAAAVSGCVTSCQSNQPGFA